MALGFVLVAAAAALLWFGTELFVEHAAAGGRRLGVTALAVGLLLAGAEPEELITAVIAALRDRGGIAAGDAIGANFTILTLVFGLAALMAALPTGGRVRRYLLGTTGLGAAAALLLSGGLTRGEGLVLVIIGAVVVVVVWTWEKAPPVVGELAEREGEEGENGEGEGARGLFLVLAGIGIMAAGGWLAVAGAERLVAALGVADSVIGLSVVALATSAELLALVISAHRHQVTELAVAGVVGSVGYNATFTLGVAALARPMTTSGVTEAAWAAAALPLVIVGLSGTKGRLGRWAGGVLVAVYAAYVALLYT